MLRKFRDEQNIPILHTREEKKEMEETHVIRRICSSHFKKTLLDCVWVLVAVRAHELSVP
jgi:hypothetical protein